MKENIPLNAIVITLLLLCVPTQGIISIYKEAKRFLEVDPRSDGPLDSPPETAQPPPEVLRAA